MELYIFDLYISVSLKGGIWVNLGDLAYEYFSVSIDTQAVLFVLGIVILIKWLKHKEVSK